MSSHTFFCYLRVWLAGDMIKEPYKIVWPTLGTSCSSHLRQVVLRPPIEVPFEASASVVHCGTLISYLLCHEM